MAWIHWGVRHHYCTSFLYVTWKLLRIISTTARRTVRIIIWSWRTRSAMPPSSQQDYVAVRAEKWTDTRRYCSNASTRPSYSTITKCSIARRSKTSVEQNIIMFREDTSSLSTFQFSVCSKWCINRKFTTMLAHWTICRLSSRRNCVSHFYNSYTAANATLPLHTSVYGKRKPMCSCGRSGLTGA
jgi:hypothetical protein